MANPETPRERLPELSPGARRIIRIVDPPVDRPAVGEAGSTPQAEIVIDHWQRLADDEPYPSFDALPVLVSLDRSAREREALDARAGAWGVWLPGDADPEAVIERIRALPLVAIEVVKFTDGRHYSLARLLRERYGFAGELRAFGNVLPDQLLYMRRCGYTAFELDAGKSLEVGLRALSAFSVAYQGDTSDPRPLYRRRAGGR